MTPAARVQTAIELLDAIVEAARGHGAPADRILAEWFRGHRFAGSKDRRAIRELVYAAIRACGPVPESGRAAMLRYAQIEPAIAPLFDGSQYGPSVIEPAERPAEGGIAPPWLTTRLAASGIDGVEAEELLERAPLDLRINTLKAERASLSLPDEARPTAAAQGVRLAPGTPVDQWPAYREGLVEIQDTGSQLACQAVGATAGETIVDLCAGAGGKTLALAAAMDNLGHLIAGDTDRGRLSKLAPRAERAGTTIIETRLLDPGRERDRLEDLTGQADAVLIDAPCSGTGTWRRNPEARWRIDPDEVARLSALQAHILDYATALVKPGGRLVYVTCSLLDAEGAEQFASFLDRHPRFAADPLDLALGSPRGAGLRLTPHHDGTDGFFIARAALAW